MVSTWEGGGSGDGRRDEGGDWPDLVECRHNPLSPLSDLTSAPEPGGDAVSGVCLQEPRFQFWEKCRGRES